eukprot:7377176-Prymnesium_polylepis.1
MNRAAAPDFFGQYARLKTLQKREPKKSHDSEGLLRTTVIRAGVRLQRLPTLAALTCCGAGRSYCFSQICHSYCFDIRREVVDASVAIGDPQRSSVRVNVKYKQEGLTALIHAYALHWGLARLVTSEQRCQQINASSQMNRTFGTRQRSVSACVRPQPRARCAAPPLFALSHTLSLFRRSEACRCRCDRPSWL